MSMDYVCPGTRGSEKRVLDTPGNGVTVGCELLCGRWETKLGSLQDQLNTLNS